MANLSRPNVGKLKPSHGASAEPASVGKHAPPPKGGKNPGEGGATIKHPGKGSKRCGACC